MYIINPKHGARGTHYILCKLLPGVNSNNTDCTTVDVGILAKPRTSPVCVIGILCSLFYLVIALLFSICVELIVTTIGAVYGKHSSSLKKSLTNQESKNVRS